MNTEELENLTKWLTDGARGVSSPEIVVSRVCESLVTAGVPLCRVGVFVQTLHPDAFGRSFVWQPDAGVVIDTAGFDLPESDRFNQSPFAILYASPVRSATGLTTPKARASRSSARCARKA
ncbi:MULTISPECIES: hypothetical protein [Bradyrhizobium]|uniref:hypothetical protein n=1 Tax=Bradyrhizobium TaxID=374 RepID=UPI0004921A02